MDLYTNCESLLKLGACISLTIIAISVCYVAARIDLGYFGDAKEDKVKAFYRLLFNVFIFLSLIVISILGIIEYFGKEITILLIFSCLVSLGVKITYDILKKG